MDLLPDSRARDPKGLILNSPMGALVPVFCANCGRGPFGHCPEQGTTFMFYQCQPCADRLGPIVGTYLMPDEVFYQRLRDEQLESHGRYLTGAELAAELEANPSSALATLVTKG